MADVVVELAFDVDAVAEEALRAGGGGSVGP